MQKCWYFYSFVVWFLLGRDYFFTLFFLGYVYLEKQIDEHNISRDRAMQQVDELRQSSDDLTRMACSYTITLNPMYQWWTFQKSCNVFTHVSHEIIM